MQRSHNNTCIERKHLVDVTTTPPSPPQAAAALAAAHGATGSRHAPPTHNHVAPSTQFSTDPVFFVVATAVSIK